MGYFDALLRYFEFRGRTTRGQYWMFQLVALVLTLGAIYADWRMTGRPFDREHLGLFTSFAVIFHAVPSVTTSVRRLHDVGKSGWWFLLWFVPVGALVILVWSCYRSVPGGDEPSTPSRRSNIDIERALRRPTRQAAHLEPRTAATQRFI
jgi:uncharacterized membrane protein YhaH (DUF805 family)